MLTKEELIPVFKECMDPELQLDVWTLGLIYNVDITENGIKILMTFTSPFCPYGPMMVDEIKEKIAAKGVKDVIVEITFEPPWQPSEELRETLGV